MNKKPIIGIPCREMQKYDWTPKINGVLVPYLQALLEVDAIPLLIPLTNNQEAIQEYYSMIDGLLLAGGLDVEPKRYQQNPHTKLGETNPAQDALEVQIINQAFTDQKPILAICRGIQILNVALGGSLIQHLEAGSTCQLNHDWEGQKEVWSKDAHKLILDSGCQLAKLLGTTEISVNSLHHQALDQVSDKLKITGKSEDGVIEAVESVDSTHYCIGVQCHPEMLFNEKDPRWKKVFAELVNATKK